jgi:tetratricopeptide (TPR) repeat protein
MLVGALLLVLGLSTLLRYLAGQSHLGAAERALKNHDLHTAQERLEKSLRQWSTARGRFLAAQTARRRDACADAERLLKRLEDTHGHSPQSELEWLLLGVQQGDLAHERHLQALVDQNDPGATLILEALAKGYMNTLRWSEMVNCADILLEQDPDHALGLVLRGRGFEGLRLMDRALADYQRAAELAPECDEARLALMELLSRLGHWPDAVAHGEVLRGRLPDNTAVLLTLARCRFDNGELDEARRLLDALLAKEPAHTAALLEKGLLALHRDQPAEAEKSLDAAVAFAPWHRRAYQLYQRCLEIQGKKEPAARYRQRLDELHARDWLGGQLWLRLRASPRDPVVRCELGKWCLENGEEQLGVRWLFTALLLDERHQATHAALADYFQRTGQERRAAHHAEIAREPEAQARDSAQPLARALWNCACNM